MISKLHAPPCPFKYVKREPQCSTSTQRILPKQHEPIRPIPIVRRSLPNSSHLRKRLAIQGNKHFSKLAASGRETPVILKGILKTSNIKFIKSFEFDPYLCETSCIQDLSKCLKKIKGAKEFNMVLRRLEVLNESDILYHPIIRFSRLTKLRIELANTTNLSQPGLSNLARAALSCSSLRSLEYLAVNLDVASACSSAILCHTARKLGHLQELKIYTATRKGKLQEGCGFMNGRVSNLRILDFGSNSSSAWTSMNPLGDCCPTTFAKMVSKLRDVRLKNTKHSVTAEDIIETMKTFVPLSFLTNFTFEFVNSKLHEREVLAFAYGLSLLPHLQRFTLKVIQKLFISEATVLNFISIIQKQLPTIEFQIYFRRFSSPVQNILSLAQTLSTLENIQCESYKGSLFVYKKKPFKIN